MKRTFSGISLKRPASKTIANCTVDIDGTDTSNFINKPSSVRNTESVIVEIPCVSAFQTPVRKTILKKAPFMPSTVSKKVEFVGDSESSLSDNDDHDEDEDEDSDSFEDKENKELNVVSPTQLRASPGLVPVPTAKATTKAVPNIIKVELSDDEDGGEDEDEYDEDETVGNDSSGSDYDSDGASRKRTKTGRVTQQMIKASLPSPTSRTTRSGRPPLTTLRLTISSKRLLSRPIQPSRAPMVLGKKFKIPTFTDPSKMPERSRTGVFTLGVKRRPPVEAKSAHDYTMEGSIILHDPAWAQLDEAQREEEKLLQASQERSTADEEDTTPQVIIPKKDKAKSKSIADMLGLVKEKDVPKVHVVVSGLPFNEFSLCFQATLRSAADAG
ncbi:hypothetical protein EDD11_002748 [Mortierella claussenii]|nr:hypothetical protein EDD11_002748 [Mortierella claussenii]